MHEIISGLEHGQPARRCFMLGWSEQNKVVTEEYPIA